MTTITTPRPPLNLFNADRAEIPSFWTTIIDVPNYYIPVNGPNPARTVEAVALLTSLIMANNGTTVIQVSLRIVDASNRTWVILNKMQIPPNDFALIDLGKQNLRSGERLEAKCENFQGATASLSYVLNQREEYTVL